MHTWGIYSPGRKLCISEAPNSFQVILNLSISPKVDSGKEKWDWKNCSEKCCRIEKCCNCNRTLTDKVYVSREGCSPAFQKLKMPKNLLISNMRFLTFCVFRCESIAISLIRSHHRSVQWHLLLLSHQDVAWTCFFSFLIILRISMNDVCYQIKIRNI